MNAHQGRITVLILYLLATGAIPVAVMALPSTAPASPRPASGEASILESESHPVENTPLLPCLEKYLPAGVAFLHPPSMGCESTAEMFIIGRCFGPRVAADRSPPGASIA